MIVATGGIPPLLAAKNATLTIPIVFSAIGDPVAAGLVASLARPSGNITGFSDMAVALMSKRLELLSELIPHAKIIALLVNPNSPTAESFIQKAQEGARGKAVQLAILRAGIEGEIEPAFRSLMQLGAGGSSSWPIRSSCSSASSS